jgi:hypothetical protein
MLLFTFFGHEESRYQEFCRDVSIATPFEREPTQDAIGALLSRIKAHWAGAANGTELWVADHGRRVFLQKEKSYRLF